MDSRAGLAPSLVQWPAGHGIVALVGGNKVTNQTKPPTKGVSTMATNQTNHLFIGHATNGSVVCTNLALQEWLNLECREYDDAQTVVDEVTMVCHQEGLAYVRDEQLAENGETPTLSLADWSLALHRLYNGEMYMVHQ